MSKIECCRDCAPPKRRPGCHGSCPEYRMERAELDKRNAEEWKKRYTRQNIYEQRADSVKRVTRHRRKERNGQM